MALSVVREPPERTGAHHDARRLMRPQVRDRGPTTPGRSIESKRSTVDTAHLQCWMAVGGGPGDDARPARTARLATC